MRDEQTLTFPNVKIWDLVEANMTDREADVAYALLGGLTDQRIAETIEMSLTRVKHYMARLFIRFHISDHANKRVALAVTLLGYCDRG